MKIFYDGLDIATYSEHPNVEGFTTNCTHFQGNHNYTKFYQKNKDLIQGRSLSLQTWKDGDSGIAQVDAIHAIDENIFVTIPIVNLYNDINERVLLHAVSKNMRINVTALYTFAQMNIAYEYLKKLTNDAIVSVFAGGISDSGHDPEPYILHAKRLFKDMPNVKIMWAGCRELYTIKRAEELDCDIISVPGNIIDKLRLFNYNLDKMSVEMVHTWHNYAIHGGLTI